MADIESMRHLWRRVLVQAVRDALGTSHVKDGGLQVSRSQARTWLEGRSDDFDHVCTLAGYSPDMVRDWWASVKNDDEKFEAASMLLRDINGGAEAVRGGRGGER